MTGEEAEVNSRSRQRFRAQRTGIGGPLGELETAVMRHVWGYGEDGCLAAEVYQVLDQESPLALTTVLTTLDRLYDKGIVRREREGKAYRYHAMVTEQELEQRIVEGVLNNLIARFPKAVATYFSQTENEDASLTDLARRIVQMQGEQPGAEEADD
jgi:predicted transcriptional regulator